MKASFLNTAAWAILTGGIVMMVILAACSGTNAPPGLEAETILNTAGVRNGLIVHIDCGDGALTAALKTNENCIVHGLSRDVATSRRTIQKMGIYGPVSIDRMNEKVCQILHRHGVYYEHRPQKQGLGQRELPQVREGVYPWLCVRIRPV